MDRESLPRRWPGAVVWGTVLLTSAYVTVALACLRQWGTPAPWSRVDVFSGGFLGLLIAAVACDIAFGLGRIGLRSAEVWGEASGMTYDAGTLVMMGLLSVGDALVFLDYGHWHLIPALKQPGVQSAGLVVEGIALAWLLWADALLAAHFAGGLSARTVIGDGPFHYVRHPRYAAVLWTRIAFALVFASGAGWPLALLWLLVLLRRIRLEERHLREVFGEEYAAYARRTPRLIPGRRSGSAQT